MPGEDVVLRVVDGVPTSDTIEDNTYTYSIDEGTVSVGDVVYQVSGANSKVARADADNASARPPIGVCASLPTSTSAVVVHSGGTVTGMGGLTRGMAYWLATTPGAVTSTRPSTNAYIVGVAISASAMVVCCVPADIAGGSGGTVTVKEDGVTVNTNFTTLNFMGAVAVADATGGQANIDITSGGNTVLLGPVNKVPLAADFPTTVLGAGSATNGSSALVFKADAHGASFDVQQILQAAPSSPWARYYRFEINPVQKQYLYGGFCIKRSSTGEFVLWSLIHTGTALELQYSEYASTTSRSSFISGVSIDPTAVYFKIEDDGSDFVLSASPAGESGTYVPVHSVSRTAFLASYDLVGFAADAFNSSGPNRDCILSIQHYGSSPPTSGTGYTVTVDVQSGISGTYTKPAGAVIAFVNLWGGSGGGGGGPRQDAASTASGGASGQAGEWLRWADNPVVIDGLSWSGGTGGAGGTGRTGSSGNGGNGSAGSDSTFAGRVAAGGNGGSGGQVTSASQGGGTAVAGGPGVSHTKLVYRSGLGGLVVGKACGSGVVGTGVAAGNSKSSGIDAAGGGGASGGTGGGLSAISAATGGNGGAQGATAGGAGGATEGAAGSAGTTPALPHLPGSAGGGGASNTNGAGGAGGAPGRGCSGAGGGAGRNGNGGDGSAGSDGGCVIRTFCLTTTA